MNENVALKRALAWSLVAVIAGLAFILAYWPLRDHHRPDALALALAAAGTAGYTALTAGMAFLYQRQLAVVREQLALERKEAERQEAARQEEREAARRQLEQADAALEAQRQATAEQTQRAEEARDAARLTLIETVRTRLDASAPRVSVSLVEAMLTYSISPVLEPGAGSASAVFVEQDQAGNHIMRMWVTIALHNFGTTAVRATSHQLNAGKYVWAAGETELPRTWLLKPSTGEPTYVRWVYEADLSHLAVTLGRHSDFGLECIFDVEDLLGTVIDTHTLGFMFTAVQQDGSRVRVTWPNVPIIMKDMDRRDNGGIARVKRAYRHVKDMDT